MKGYVVSGYSTLLYKGFRLRKEKRKMLRLVAMLRFEGDWPLWQTFAACEVSD